MVHWEKICPNLSFPVENKIENLHKAGHILNVSSNFKKLSTNWDKYVFYWENGILNLLEILHIPQKVCISKMLISTKTDNHT